MPSENISVLSASELLQEGRKLPFSAINADSRHVGKGGLFAALPGSKTDGKHYITTAVNNGARVLLVQGKDLEEAQGMLSDTDESLMLVSSENIRKDFALLAAKFYALQPAHIAAVTGTSGKTSTVSFVQQLWHLNGIDKCASLGTLGLRGPNMRKSGSLTTPDAQTLHAVLADLKAAGIDHLAMEASSHGLDQYRLDGVKVGLAAFTNLSRDHLDYHPDMDSYFVAKERLFTELLAEGGTAVINADDPYGDRLAKNLTGRNIKTYGRKGEHIRLVDLVPAPDGQDLVLEVEGRRLETTLPLVGDFQVMNALCALGIVHDEVGGIETLVESLKKLRGVPGRLQLVPGHEKGAVYVDYAHKPAALEIVLDTLRPHTQGRLICVFGCGGNRDAGKRSMMGKIAADKADIVIVTDDNPRYEDAAAIRAAILDAAPKAEEIGDRGQAIRHAVGMLEEGDVLVIAGKGHEEGQSVAGQVTPFNDVEEARKAIEGL